MDSFCWPKVHLWKGDKKLGGVLPPPHLDKIQKKNSYTFSGNLPLVAVRFQKKITSTREKRVNRDIFGQTLKMKDVFLIYFGQIVSCCAKIYSNTSSLNLFCKNSSLNLANFIDRVIFCVKSWKSYPNPKIFYTCVTCYTIYLWQIPCLTFICIR